MIVKVSRDTYIAAKIVAKQVEISSPEYSGRALTLDASLAQDYPHFFSAEEHAHLYTLHPDDQIALVYVR